MKFRSGSAQVGGLQIRQRGEQIHRR
uniref:Uncharacterized protein n=1 Tax=Arundo donax TaxID=35708 RepID=A0A0A9G4G0_ARUDO